MWPSTPEALLPPHCRRYPLPSGEATLVYVDETESREQHTCCVPVVEHDCPEDRGFETALLHFGQYADIWELLGRQLSVDTQRHPRLGALMEAIKAGGRPR